MSDEFNISPQAMSVADFCRAYGLSRTLVFELLKANVLPAKKCGRRTLIPTEAAEAWFRNLPNQRDTK
jgi:excisionase family DNA binding protein